MVSFHEGYHYWKTLHVYEQAIGGDFETPRCQVPQCLPAQGSPVPGSALKSIALN